MTYCISDIHGCYDQFMELLALIDFQPTDTLYILGDAIDRGNASVKCLQYIKNTPNIHMLIGNHEYMMINALADKEEASLWLDYNGGNKTLAELEECSEPERKALVEYVTTLPYHFTIELNNEKFLLIHAGLQLSKKIRKQNLPFDEIIKRQKPKDMVWIRDGFYYSPGLSGYKIIFGHTPTTHLNRRKQYKIWHDPRFKDKICIDCGCVYGGRLAALRLEDMNEFYADTKSRSY